MRLASVRTAGGTSAGRVEGDRIVLLPWRNLSELLRQPDWQAAAASAGSGNDRDGSVDVDEADLATLLPTPNKIICLGLNYETHILEMGHEKPAFPTLFAKYSGALIGARDAIQLPSVSTKMDWEVELGIVIGRAGRCVDEADALDHIAGYCAINDITARDWQHHTTQFISGKTFEATTPVGPWLVTSDELPPGASGLTVRCEVDGELMQEASSADLCFKPAAIIAYISQIITLLPGDLIATGTPGGVGDGRTPPVYLRAGQTVRTSIDGIGEMVNMCVAWPPAGRAPGN